MMPWVKDTRPLSFCQRSVRRQSGWRLTNVARYFSMDQRAAARVCFCELLTWAANAYRSFVPKNEPAAREGAAREGQRERQRRSEQLNRMR